MTSRRASANRPCGAATPSTGPGWSGLLAFTGLVLGTGALLFALFAPIGARGPAGIVWIAMFGALAIGTGVPGAPGTGGSAAAGWA